MHIFCWLVMLLIFHLIHDFHPTVFRSNENHWSYHLDTMDGQTDGQKEWIHYTPTSPPPQLHFNIIATSIMGKWYSCSMIINVSSHRHQPPMHCCPAQQISSTHRGLLVCFEAAVAPSSICTLEILNKFFSYHTTMWGSLEVNILCPSFCTNECIKYTKTFMSLCLYPLIL